jgi:protein O-GlcNAc transferase
VVNLLEDVMRKFKGTILWAARSFFLCLVEVLRKPARVFLTESQLRRAVSLYLRVEEFFDLSFGAYPRVFVPDAVVTDEFIGRMYEYTALCYRDRGMIRQALHMYQMAESLNDPKLDAEACQLALTSPDHDDEALERLHRRWSEKFLAPQIQLVRNSFVDRSWSSDRRITVGYHCSFWPTECAEALALSVFRCHDRGKFKIIGYSPVEEEPRVEKAFEIFRSGTKDLSDSGFAELVRADGVDIFVELSGLSNGHRYGAISRRAAPIQANYVNHLGTTQVANLDYIIGDEVTFPPMSDGFFSEKILRLPRCFLAYNYDQILMPGLVDPPCLETGYVTFGSFGGAFKLNPECLNLWSSVLRSVPNSRFLMQNSAMSNDSCADFMRQQFSKRGVPSSRVTILPGTDRMNNLLNYSRMDISLDSWPYCGGNSLAEALWQGVPVITLRGPRATSAYGASLLSAAGLEEMVAESPSQFVKIAQNLSSDQDGLKQLRYQLRSKMQLEGLSDPFSMVRALESGYREMMVERFGDPSSEILC